MVTITRKLRSRSELCFFFAIGGANAAGALAVGVCGAYGYGFDFRKVTDARVAAMRKCSGSRARWSA